MKSIKIGNRHIVLAHITHFNFISSQGADILEESSSLPGYQKTGLKEVPAQLTIYIKGTKALKFSDEEAETGNRMLTEIFPHKAINV